MWVFWEPHLEIRYLVRTCGALGGDLVVVPGGSIKCCRGSCLIYFKSSLLQVSPPLLANLSLTTTIPQLSLYVCIYIYINICTFMYIHMYINLFQATICLQPNAHTTAVQKSRQLQTSFFPTVSVRLCSKSLLVLIWDKGTLSLFSWRVAMATWHKDISIAGWGQTSPPSSRQTLFAVT